MQRKVCVLIAVAAIFSSSLRADTLILNDGSKVEGTVVEETSDTIVLKVKFGQVPYKKIEIKEVIRAGSGPAVANAADLRDVLTLKTGEEHRGLLVSDDGKIVTFDLIMSGKNVSKTMLSRTTFQSSEVKELKQITEAQRAAVRDYLQKVDSQAKQDTINEQNMKIETISFPAGDTGKTLDAKKIELEHFTVISDAGDDFLKRSTYKLSKVFSAYKQHFGVDRNQSNKVKVLICNSMEEYYMIVGNGMKNPAFYAPKFKMIMAGCDCAKYEAQIAAIRDYHKKLDQQLEDWKRKVNNARADVQEQVRKAYEQVSAGGKGTTPEGQAALEKIKAQQREWQVQIGQMEKQVVDVQNEINTLNKRNDLVFAEYTKLMFAVLYHEGFHAFLDNFLFTAEAERDAVPRWLNEGLAQYFEASRLEGDRFVLGQEDRAKMAILRKFKKEDVLLSLEKLVTGGQSDYIVHDLSNVENSTKNYLQAWLLTNVLGEKGRLTRENLQAYVKALAAKKSPLDALQILSGISSADLQKLIDDKVKSSIEAPSAPAEKK